MKGLANYVTREGARFEDLDVFCRESIIVDSRSEKLKQSGIPMMTVGKDRYATTKDELHCFVIGDTGSGKTRRIVFPTVRLMGKAGYSMVISDPKGEIYRKTSRNLKDAGYDVFVLNFRQPSRGNKWNPLDLVEKYYNGGPELKERSMTVLKDVVSILKQDVHSDRDTFWEQAAESTFIGMALLLLEYGDKGSLTFNNISALAQRLCSEKEFRTTEGFARLNELPNQEGRYKYLVDSIQSLPDPSEVKESLNSYLNAADATYRSIMAVFNGMVAPFMNLQSVSTMISSTDFDLEQFGKKPTVLYLILPDDSTAFYHIATLLVKQLYSTLVYQADSNPNGQLNNPVRFILDEFANFTPIDDFDAMLTAGRSRRIGFVLVCQSMDQLYKKYGEIGAHILMDNCRVWIYLNCRNPVFLHKLVDLMGNRCSPYTGEDRPLISTVDLQHLDVGEVVILNDRCYPMKGMLPDFSKYDFGDGLNNDEMCDFPATKPMGEKKIIDVDMFAYQLYLSLPSTSSESEDWSETEIEYGGDQ